MRFDFEVSKIPDSIRWQYAIKEVATGKEVVRVTGGMTELNSRYNAIKMIKRIEEHEEKNICRNP